ncbi:MAG TPA: helix-turn-helix domain-containing protein [Pseudolysinimonas sp.]|jgi:excisionase family DNA binding protein
MAPAALPPDSSALGRFLTLADTAEVLNISASQAYALVRSGELPAIKIGGSGGGRGAGGHWRVERDVLEGYIAGKYEENRRRNLWNQAEFADIPELFADRER